MRIFIFILLGVILVAAFAGSFMSQVEQPDYQVVTVQNKIEIRDYPGIILAQVEVEGERKEAIRSGFKILADYIFGNNTAKTNIDMTAPVMQEGAADRWMVSFVMPKAYTLQTLPTPNRAQVKLLAREPKRFAVIRFSGSPDDQDLKTFTDRLNAYVKQEGLQTLGEPIFAFYNPPWTLPFLRRNEVMIEIAPTS